MDTYQQQRRLLKKSENKTGLEFMMKAQLEGLQRGQLYSKHEMISERLKNEQTSFDFLKLERSASIKADNIQGRAVKNKAEEIGFKLRHQNTNKQMKQIAGLSTQFEIKSLNRMGFGVQQSLDQTSLNKKQGKIMFQQNGLINDGGLLKQQKQTSIQLNRITNNNSHANIQLSLNYLITKDSGMKFNSFQNINNVGRSLVKLSNSKDNRHVAFSKENNQIIINKQPKRNSLRSQSLFVQDLNKYEQDIKQNSVYQQKINQKEKDFDILFRNTKEKLFENRIQNSSQVGKRIIERRDKYFNYQYMHDSGVLVGIDSEPLHPIISRRSQDHGIQTNKQEIKKMAPHQIKNKNKNLPPFRDRQSSMNMSCINYSPCKSKQQMTPLILINTPKNNKDENLTFEKSEMAPKVGDSSHYLSSPNPDKKRSQNSSFQSEYSCHELISSDRNTLKQSHALLQYDVKQEKKLRFRKNSYNFDRKNLYNLDGSKSSREEEGLIKIKQNMDKMRDNSSRNMIQKKIQKQNMSQRRKKCFYYRRQQLDLSFDETKQRKSIVRLKKRKYIIKKYNPKIIIGANNKKYKIKVLKNRMGVYVIKKQEYIRK